MKSRYRVKIKRVVGPRHVFWGEGGAALVYAESER